MKSIKEFEFAGFISERFTLGNRYGSKNEAIQSHRVTFSKQLYKFETANIIYLQETCSNHAVISIFADISGGWCKYVFFFSRLTENQNEEGMAFYEKKLGNIIIPRFCLVVEYRPDIWQVPIEKKRKTISRKCQICLI